MIDTRYQIFISSTYKDLKEERQKVTMAILKLYHFPIGMEMFHADNEEQWCQIKNTIDMSDYYVLIVGRYCGTMVEDEGISYTEKEYDYAMSKKIPILSFIISDTAKKESYGMESTRQRNAYKKFLRKVRKLPCQFWNTADELALQVASTLSIKFAENNRRGWIPRNLLMSQGNWNQELSGQYMLYYHSYSKENTELVKSLLEIDNKGATVLLNNVDPVDKNRCEYRYRGYCDIQGNIIYIFLNNTELYERCLISLSRQMGRTDKFLGMFLALTSSGVPVCLKVAVVKNEPKYIEKINMDVLKSCLKDNRHYAYSKYAYINETKINNIFFSDSIYLEQDVRD